MEEFCPAPGMALLAVIASQVVLLMGMIAERKRW
jgi:hypothetical protein